ncbi:FkbM family methyltransferase [Mucilaginibacter puniceus]
MNRLYENRNHNPLSNGEVTLLKKIARFNPELIIDGGANIGNYANLVNTYCPMAKVYSFEPVAETYHKLEAHLTGNPKNILINKGLYNENCTKVINIFPCDEHASLYDINSTLQTATGTIEIDLVKGDDFLAQNDIKNVFLLKLDLEGAEYDALLGFENALKNGVIKLIQFEYGYINITTKRLLIDYYQLLESYGYVVGKLFPKTVEFRKYQYKHEDFIGPNFIAVHKNEAELIKALSSK